MALADYAAAFRSRKIGLLLLLGFASGLPLALTAGTLQAWLAADRKDLILGAARNESDAGVRTEAIEALGAMDASAELKQLFDTTHDAPNQRAIIQALAM